MPWFKVDDGFWSHPKCIAAPPAAVALWVRAGAWAAQHMTDGMVPKSVLPMLQAKQRDADALVSSGLWQAVDGGWRFHDWTDYQPTRAETLDKRAKRSEAGRIGGIKSGEARRENAGEDEANAEANASALASGSLHTRANPRPGPARPAPGSLLGYISRLAAGNARGDEPPPAEVISSWQEHAGPHVDLEDEAKRYLMHHGDRPAKNERAAWLGWLSKARARAELETQQQAIISLVDSDTYRSEPKPPHDCYGGWLDDEDGKPVPCLVCRPHLRAV